MAYTPNIWVDREGTTRYFETVEKDGAKIFTPDYSQLTEIGTPVNADNMNHIEEGIAAGSFTKYDSNTVYQINDLVTLFEDGELKVYKSLKNENYNNPVADAKYWEEVSLGGGGTLQMFDTVLKDHILTFEESQGLALQGTYVYKDGVSGSRYGYPDFYAKCLEEKETATATETTLGSNIVTIYANANGHRFYDIADKTVIDEWYETYGIADFYGVDTENERIFLPRNKHFMQLTDDTSKVNNMVEAGLPNITGTFHGGMRGVLGQGVFATYTDTSGGKGYEWDFEGNKTGIDFNASRSSAIYGKSDTVQPQASLKLLYYCVGNTSSLSAITDVTQITTSENDTLPLFHNFYSQEDMTSTGAYVNASLGSWLSGNIYETAYNELVNKIGTDNVKAVTDTYTDYDFVVNQDDMTFRLPLLNGKECLPSDDKISQTILASDESYTAPQNGWYSYLVVSSVANGTVNLYCEETGLAHLTQANANMASRGSIPVKKGDVVNYIYPTNSTNILFFVPAKGDGNLYYKVANAVTNLELLNAGEVLNAVNLKADINLSNVNENGKSLMSGMAMPSNKYIDITLGASGSTYIAPANGWFALAANATSDGYLSLNANNMEAVDQHAGGLSVFMPVKKNDTVRVGYGGAISAFRYFRLIYAQGSESEV